MREDGFLVIDKPPGVTSHDVVAVVRAVTGIKKVGHTGTLDPFATGVLPLALGNATRLIQYLDENEKVYDAHVLLGRATDTGDPTGQTIAEAPVPALSREQVEAVLTTFVGPRMQTPPRYSAVKVAGRPLYQYARKGVDVAAQPRPVTVYGMELLELAPPRVRVLIRCSRGTYARVLAEEIGVALGTVGHLDELRRTGSGRFLIDDALTFSRLSELVCGDPAWDRCLRPGRGEARVPWRHRDEVLAGLARHVMAPRDALRHLPAVAVSPAAARAWERSGIAPPPPTPECPVWVLLVGDEVIGVATNKAPVPEAAAAPAPRPSPAPRLRPRVGEGEGGPTVVRRRRPPEGGGPSREGTS